LFGRFFPNYLGICDRKAVILCGSLGASVGIPAIWVHMLMRSGSESPIEVFDKIVCRFQAYADSYQCLADAGCFSLGR